MADAIHARGLASVGNMQCTVWETSWYIRGMEPLMMDMMCDEEMAEVILDRVTQNSLMMSEELYVTWIKPRLKQVIEAAKAIKPDIIVFYHSCGFVEPLIPHLIEAGIDVLNPIQPECMDFEEIFEKYGDQVAFHGTVGTQSVMPFGTPEEVKAVVKKNLDIAGSKGDCLWRPPICWSRKCPGKISAPMWKRAENIVLADKKNA